MVSVRSETTVRSVIEQSGLPSAAIQMPDQVLVRERRSFFRLKPLFHWFAVR